MWAIRLPAVAGTRKARDSTPLENKRPHEGRFFLPKRVIPSWEIGAFIECVDGMDQFIRIFM